MNRNIRFFSLLLVLAMLAALISGCDAQKAADTAQTVLEAVDIISEIISDESTAAETPAPTATPRLTATPRPAPEPTAAAIDEDGYYYTKDEVALYIHTYGRLPGNFVTKKDAEKTGWTGGSLEKYLPGKVIGGSRFGNYEGLLPARDGRVWTECDINTLGKSKRGSERIVFSNDGLIYYTGDHYESFELLYGTPEA